MRNHYDEQQLKAFLEKLIVKWEEYACIIRFLMERRNKGHRYKVKTYELDQAKDAMITYIRSLDSKIRYKNLDCGLQRKSDYIDVVMEKCSWRLYDDIC